MAWKKSAVSAFADFFLRLFGIYGYALRDGSSVITCVASADPEPFTRIRDPCYVDLEGGKPVIRDEDEVVDEVSYWPKPDFSDKATSKSTPMWHVLSARPQRLEINTYQNCDFWKAKGQFCKYCYTGFISSLLQGAKKEFIDLEDEAETVGEALKHPVLRRIASRRRGAFR